MQLDTISQNFFRNPFVLEASKHTNYGFALVGFHQTVEDFYLQEPIAAYSPTRGECSLFIGREKNFSFDM